MASVLLLTEDTELLGSVTAICEGSGLTLRHVVTAEHAKERFSLQPFACFIIDAAFKFEANKVKAAAELFGAGWSKHPLMIGVLFSEEQLGASWAANLSGASICTGADREKELEQILKAIPSRVSIGGDWRSGVLICEDLDAPRDIISAYVESLGYDDVLGAESVEKALELLRAQPRRYFCVITDLAMPNVNGIEFIERVRAEPELESIPMVVLTSEPTPEHLVAAIKAGATGFLTKPPKKQLLRAELQKAKRIILAGTSPRLCETEDAEKIAGELRLLGLG